MRQAVSDELDLMLKEGIIERIEASPWIFRIVLTTKKGRKIRLCANLHESNRAIVADNQPLPHTEELLSEHRGAAVFSTKDLASAYHQLPLHQESRDLTALIFIKGSSATVACLIA